MKGKFVTIEGCDGVGKSSQVELLREYFERIHVPVYFAREPGGTGISEQIRDIILQTGNAQMDALTELMLYSAARRQLTIQEILPRLEAGQLVVCDRYIDSTTAYQGYGRGLDLEMIRRLNGWAMGDARIDLTIFIDLCPDNGFHRKGGADNGDRLESENIDFHRSVYKGYLAVLAAEPERVKRVDGAQKQAQIFQHIVQLFQKKAII